MNYLLKNEDVIGLPTDTVYGLGCLAQSSIGIDKIYKIKGRSLSKPISICVSDIDKIGLYGDISHLDSHMINELFPGKITIVVKRQSILNPKLNPNSNLVGIRIPNCDLVRNISRINGAIALTSANISGESSSTSVDQFESLLSKLTYVIDTGSLESNLGSTVVDLSNKGYYNILRKGDDYNIFIECLEKYGLKSL